MAQFKIRVLFWEKESFAKVDKQTGEETLETRAGAYNFKTYPGRDLSSAFALIENIFKGKERYGRSAKKLYITEPGGREIYEFPSSGLAYPSTREKASQKIKFLNILLQDMSHYRNKGFFPARNANHTAQHSPTVAPNLNDSAKSKEIHQTKEKVAQNVNFDTPKILGKLVAEAWRKARGEDMPEAHRAAAEKLIADRGSDKTLYFEYLCYCARTLTQNKKTYNEFLNTKQ